MGKPSFDVIEYFTDKEKNAKDFLDRKKAIDKLREIIKGDILSIEINADKLYIVLQDGRRYNWRMNSIEDNNFTVLTHTGVYEKEAHNILKKLIKDKATILDIGANKGWYSVIFAKVANDGVVYAIEPTTSAFEELEENVKINNLTNVVTCKVAFSNYSGKGRMTIPFDHSALAYLELQSNDENRNEVNVMTLDDFVREKEISSVDLIKIDAEGSEYNIIMGAKELLTSHNAPIIFIEAFDNCLLRYGKNTGDLIRVLTQYGYYVYNVETLEEYTNKCVDGLDTDLLCTKKRLEDIK